MGRRVNAQKYQNLLETILEKSGFKKEDAGIIASIMVDNEKLGISTHGSWHMITYVQKFKVRSIDPYAEISVIDEGPTWARMDAHGGFGFLASYKAMQIAMKKAKEFGMAYVTVKNSSHYGTGAAYELMAAKEGMASIVCSNTWQLMAVPGSKGKVIGNSPIGYGFPTKKNPPIFMDIATSAASLTKVRRCAEVGEKVPDGWIVDENGIPTNDPTIPEYSLVPFGGHKGYGWAFFVEALAAVASPGGKFLSAVGEDWLNNIDLVPGVCHAFIVIDLDKMLGKGVFEERMDACIDEMHSYPKAANADRIYVPGEIEADHKKDAEANGIELMDAHIARMQKVCEMFDLSMDDVFID